MAKRFILENHAYHTISVTRGRVPFFTQSDASECVHEGIQWEREAGHAYVLAYAILPDHLHLLIVPREPFDVSRVMHNLKSVTAKAINKALNTAGPVWQQSFYDRVLRDEEQLRTTNEYIQQNPVAARLVDRAEDYRWSSAHASAEVDIETFLGR